MRAVAVRPGTRQVEFKSRDERQFGQNPWLWAGTLWQVPVSLRIQIAFEPDLIQRRDIGETTFGSVLTTPRTPSRVVDTEPDDS